MAKKKKKTTKSVKKTARKRPVPKAVEPVPPEGPHDDRRPVSGGFMVVSIVGFLISVTYTFSGRFNKWFAWSGENAGYTWGFLFILFFLLMFIAAVVSMTPKGDQF